jgi:hypothetical protein
MAMPRWFGEGEIVSVPGFAREGAVAQVSGFVVCPMVFSGAAAGSAGWATDVYRLAYEQAEASVRPSWFERVIAGSAN